jgi:hypothetical protein
VKKALQAIKNRIGISTERAHYKDTEKEEESRECKLVALEQIATTSLQGTVTTKRIATNVYLL